jgi:hypothetical protein
MQVSKSPIDRRDGWCKVSDDCRVADPFSGRDIDFELSEKYALDVGSAVASSTGRRCVLQTYGRGHSASD